MKSFLFLKARTLQLLLTCFILFGGVFASAQTYDPYELQQLRAFLRQPSGASGQINAQRLGMTLADTANWTTETSWVTKVTTLTWRVVDGVSHVKQINWTTNKNLAGHVDFSNFMYLQILGSNANNQYILAHTSNKFASLNFSGCPLLTIFDISVGSAPLNTINISGCTGMQTVIITGANLKNLDVSGCANLTKAWITATGISSLNLSASTNMNDLRLNGNPGLTSLNVSTMPNLVTLHINGTNISSIDLSANLSLSVAHLYETKISGVFDVSMLPALTELVLYSTDVSEVLFGENNTALAKLNLNYTPNLINLDLSACTGLTYLAAMESNLSALDISNNPNLAFLSIFSSKFRFSTLPLPTDLLNTTPNGTTVGYYYAPQSNIDFGNRNYNEPLDLSDENQITYNGNTYATEFVWKDATSLEEITTGITNNDGVFSFDNSLVGRSLLCEMTNDVFWDADAPAAYASYKQLTMKLFVTLIDPDMPYVIPELNQLRAFLRLPSAENPKSNADLLGVDTTTWLGTPDWAENLEGVVWEQLGDLHKIKTIDWNNKNLAGKLILSNCAELTSVICNNNHLTALDLSGCPKLTTVICNDNNLKFSTMTAPEAGITTYTYLPQKTRQYNVITPATALDLSSESMINETSATTYEWFDVTGGAHTPITTGITDNNKVFTIASSLAGKTLRCEMSNPLFSDLTLNFEVPVVATMEYEPAELNQLLVNMARNEQNALKIGLSAADIAMIKAVYNEWATNPVNVNEDHNIDQSWVPKIEGITWKLIGTKYYMQHINWASKGLTGVFMEFMSAPFYLETINISGNNYDAIIIAYVASEIDEGRQLRSVWAQNNPKAYQFSIFQVELLDELNLINCPKLRKINLESTGLESFNNTGAFPVLQDLSISRSPLKEIDLTKFPALTKLSLDRVEISGLDLSKNTALQMLQVVGSRQLNEIDVAKQTNLTILRLAYNSLTTLDISKQTKLEELNILDNKFTFSTFPKLPSTVTFYTYSPQDTIVGGAWKCNEEITDLKDEASINDIFGRGNYKNTDFKWYYYNFGERVNLVKSYDYEEPSPGVFKFPAALNQKTLYCEMTNENYPGGNNTTPELVIVYQVTLDGIIMCSEVTGLQNTGSGTDVALTWNKISEATGYNIYKNNALVQKVTTNSYTENDLPVGKYQYCVTALYDDPECESSKVCTTVDIVGINELGQTAISMYPNPTSGKLQITNGGLEIADISVFDITGRLILEKTNINNAKITLDLSNYANGIYFVKVNNGKTIKVVKQ